MIENEVSTVIDEVIDADVAPVLQLKVFAPLAVSTTDIPLQIKVSLMLILGDRFTTTFAVSKVTDSLLDIACNLLNTLLSNSK